MTTLLPDDWNTKRSSLVDSGYGKETLLLEKLDSMAEADRNPEILIDMLRILAIIFKKQGREEEVASVLGEIERVEELL